MKFIKNYKIFESQDWLFSQSDIDDICSLFRDFVDEFDLQKYDGENSNNYFSYRCKAYNDKWECIKSDSVQFNSVSNIERLDFTLFFPLECEYHISEKEIMSSIEDFINRVSEMGHHTKKEIEYVDESEGTDIDTLTIKITL